MKPDTAIELLEMEDDNPSDSDMRNIANLIRELTARNTELKESANSGLSKKEIIILDKLLEYSGQLMGRRICNDLDDDFWNGWTDEEKEAFANEYGQYNGDPETHYEAEHMMDFMVLGLLRHKMNSGEWRPPIL